MFDNLKILAAAAALAITPFASNALTIEVDDLSTVGVDQTASGASFASISGAAGGFTVSIASGSISSTPNSHTLNTTSVQVAGVGTLAITVEETGLDGFSDPFLWLVGTGTVSDVSSSITVEHMVDLGSGYETVGDVMAFTGGTGPVNLGDSTSEMFGIASTIALKTIITVTTLAGDQSANVNATLSAAVPLPAGGLLLLTALGAGGVAARRRKG